MPELVWFRHDQPDYAHNDTLYTDQKMTNSDNCLASSLGDWFYKSKDLERHNHRIY